MSSVKQKNPAQPDNDAPPETKIEALKPQSGSTYSPKPLENSQINNLAADSGAVTKTEAPVESFSIPETATFDSFVNNIGKKNAIQKSRLRYAIFLLLDTSLIVVAFILAYLIRYSFQIGSEVLEENHVPLSDYYTIGLVYLLILMFTLHFKGFYRQARTRNLLDEFGIIFSSTLIAVASMMVLVFISRPLSMSRLMFVYLVPLTFFSLSMERSAARIVRRLLWSRGIGVRNLLVIGATDSACRLMQAVVEKPGLGYQLQGYVDDDLRFSEWTIPARYRNGEEVPHLGSLEELDELIYIYNVDEVAIALPATHYKTINQIMAECRESGVDFILVPDVFELRVDALSFAEINGVPIIGLKGNNLRGWNYVIKRAMDIFFALFFLTLTSPLLLIVAILVKLDSPGPIIYKQTRVGKYGKPFTFYKFRSMKVNADKMVKDLMELNETGGPTFKISNDPRRTRVGKVIRRTSVDELPQFFNILIGQMSFVGPRPPITYEVQQYEEWHYRRLEVTPGLTGLWQVSGRSKLQFEDMVKLDIYYTENWSIWLDLKILIRTIPAVFRGDGAY